MKTERWQQISQLYDAALARDASERAAFLRNACDGDLALQREVESLAARERESFPEVGPSVEASDLPDDLIGQQLGTYKVLSLLGAGGMGEVYRARDTKLGRDIAIKVLPSRFTADRDRLARFEREARILATLNHPHIGAIYGFETAGSVCALVLELVEGPTLANRLTQGPIPPNEALRMARQIAEALGAAHEKGIVHRDLKPANVVITGNGLVKVLDFGLAKAVTGDASPTDLSQSPTLTLGGTQDGVILGTAAYMSPEQARGLTVDKRTDIWAFGCVLYEMLTGRGPFLGPTVTDTLAAILEREPAWDALPGATPRVIRRLLKRCLEKDPKRRLLGIADARIEMDGVLSGPTRPRVLLPWAMAVVTSIGALIAVGALTWYVRAPEAQTAAWRWFAPSETPSVAVLPFNTIGTGDQYFADGITEAVTTELGRVGSLRVIASNSTFAYRDKTAFRDIGRELGVGLVVKGSVQRADGRVRIDVSLVDTRDDTALWSER